jgi:hypothetical protein
MNMATKPAMKQVPTKPAAMPPKAELRVLEGGAIVDDRPAFLKESKRGSENVTHKDMVIPRLEVCQALSPARKKDHADYIEGAEEGMLYNSVTRELYGTDVKVVPCFYLKEWLIWKDRKKGGGFRGAYPTEAEAKTAIHDLKDKDGKPENADEFAALDTAQHFCLLLTETGKVQQIVISMSKSKMKVSRKWNSLISLSDDDSFAKAYRVEAISETNANNEDYFNIKIMPAGYVNEKIYTAGEALYELLKAGGASADRTGLDVDDEAIHGKSAKAAGSGEF